MDIQISSQRVLLVARNTLDVEIFALAPSEAKLSAITGFHHFSALDLTSEVTG